MEKIKEQKKPYESQRENTASLEQKKSAYARSERSKSNLKYEKKTHEGKIDIEDFFDDISSRNDSETKMPAWTSIEDKMRKVSGTTRHTRSFRKLQ